MDFWLNVNYNPRKIKFSSSSSLSLWERNISGVAWHISILSTFFGFDFWFFLLGFFLLLSLSPWRSTCGGVGCLCWCAGSPRPVQQPRDDHSADGAQRCWGVGGLPPQRVCAPLPCGNHGQPAGDECGQHRQQSACRCVGYRQHSSRDGEMYSLYCRGGGRVEWGDV